MIHLEPDYFQSLMQTSEKEKTSDITWFLTEIHIIPYEVFLLKKIKTESNQANQDLI